MSRARIRAAVIVFAVVAIIVGGVYSLSDYLSYRNVTFTLSQNTKSITIFAGEKEVTTLNSSGQTRLKPGSYSVKPSGDKVSPSPMPVVIKNDTSTIPIDPYFSDSYLSSSFSGEISNIHASMTAKYPVLSNYYISQGTFYHFGDWYGTIMFYSPKDGSPSAGNVFSVIMHKVDNKWQVAAEPSVVFTYKNFPDIPKDVIEAVNKLPVY